MTMQPVEPTKCALLLNRFDQLLKRELTYRSLIPLFFLYAFISRLRFSPYRFTTLAGDDLYMYVESNRPGGALSTMFGSVWDHGAGKWRPLPQIVLSPLLDLLGESFWKYQVLNEMLLAGTSILVVMIIANVSKILTPIAVVAGVIPLISNFNLYYVLQVLGIMEFLALGTFLLTLLVLSNLRKPLTVTCVLTGNLCFFLSIHSHERYILVAPSIMLLTFFRLEGALFKRKFFLSCLPLLSISFNYFMKTQVFGMHFLSGAGGTDISSSTLDIPRFFWTATLNIFGYNIGPNYLSSKNASELGLTSVFLCLCWAGPAVYLITHAAFTITKKLHQRSISVVLIVLGTLFPLLLSASIAFRQEFRWLMAPHVVLVILVAITASYSMRTSKSIGVIFIIAMLGVGANSLFYAQYSRSTYFFMTQQFNDSAYERIFVEYGDQLDQITFVVVGSGDATYTWATASGQFYRAYAKELGVEDFIDVREISSLAEVSSLENTRPTQIFLQYSGPKLIQLP